MKHKSRLKKKDVKENLIEKKTKLKRQNGITLIALVITIIILLILAAVSIATLTGENGILTRANNAKENTEQAEDNELRKLTQAEAATYIEEHEYTDVSGEKVTIPAQCAVSQVEGENTLEDGLVIIDINGNEWVWIEVPKSEMPESLTFENENDYTILETTLQTYVSNYRASYVDEWYSKEQHGFANADEYNNLKKLMLKSIYENGGFYIGRFEVGSFDNPVTSNDTTRKAVIKKGAYPYNFVTCNQAQKLAESFAIEGKNSSLMFGIQWDLVLKYLEINGKWDTSTHEASYYLKTDSSLWGNYRNSEFVVLTGNKMQPVINYKLEQWNDVSENYVKPSYDAAGYGVLLSTGATERNKKMNIYDLAGNVIEWSLEKSNKIDSPCSSRGGYCTYTGSITPASYRNVGDVLVSAYSNGFRPALY